MEVEKILRSGKGTVVDVRTRREFSGGHVVGSINIPLTELPEEIEELKSLKAPLLLCCASGLRSGQAEYYLRQAGLECINAGSWLKVNYLQSHVL